MADRSVGAVLRLPEAERATLRRLCDTLIAGAPPAANGSPLQQLSASDRGVDREIARVVEEYLTPRQRVDFRRLLRTVESRSANLLLSGRPERFARLDAPGRERYLRSWSESRLAVKRRGFHALKRLALFLYYGTAGTGGPNPVWPEIGYVPSGAPAPAEIPTPAAPPPEPPPRSGTAEADVVVVGSGAGGSVIAARVAAAGFRVIVLEEGPYLRGGSFPTVEADGFDRMLRSHGLLTTQDLAIGVLAGRVAGGSTTVNWMTCLRPPPEVLREWAGEHGLAGVDQPGFEAVFRRVEERLQVSRAESDRNGSNDALAVGCERLGYALGTDYEIISRNAVGCRSRCQTCFFGCPYDAKRSSLVTHLEDARTAGAQLWCDTHADRVELAGGRATGVSATYAGSGGPYPVHVRARAVVAAGSAVETPALLLRSGVRGAAGRGLHLHPTAALLAEYDRPIRNWVGPMQTVAVRRFTRRDPGVHGPWFEAAPAHPGLSALATPWRGSDAHKAEMRRVARAAATIVLVRDHGAGRVRIDPEGNPELEYRLDRRDRENLSFGLSEAARIHHAAGALRIATLHTRPIAVGDGRTPITSAELEDLQEAILREGVRENALALFSAHPTGSAHAGVDPRSATARPTGEVHGVDGLWIGDGSLLPTAPGVNPMIAIMALAERTADYLLASLGGSRPAQIAAVKP